MPCVSRTPHIRLAIVTCLTLLQAVLHTHYSLPGPLHWDSIFLLHSMGFVLAGHLLMASTFRRHARLRALAATLPGSTWPPDEQLLEGTFIVYLMWSPWRPYIYVGKTVHFKERLRKHLYAFLTPQNDSQQPSMEVLRCQANRDAPLAASSWLYLPIARFSNDAEAVTLEQHLISTEHPHLNEPYVRKLLGTHAGYQALGRHLRLTAAPPTAPARLTQRLAHAHAARPRAQPALQALCPSSASAATSVTRWAHLACNTLATCDDAQGHAELYRLSPDEWFAVWHRVRRRHEGTTRAIGLKTLDSVRRFRCWPRPRLSVQGALPWLPGEGVRRVFHFIVQQLILDVRSRGQTLMLPMIRDLTIALSPVSTLTLRSALRNAPRFYRRLGETAPWACTCHLHPNLPRFPSPDGESHIFAPQDTWPWPPELGYLRTMPSHAAVVPSKSHFLTTCSRLLHRIVDTLHLACPPAFIDACVSGIASTIDFDTLSCSLDFQPIPYSAIGVGRSLTAGLVVEEFQKTKHVLVAECPRRVQLLCSDLFGISGQNTKFEYFPGLPAEAVLQQVCQVPGLRDHLQPARLSSRRHWRMATASAPNKKREKPDGRRPLVDRSHWPTQGLESPAARAIDWISQACIPEHLHIDAQRTDSVLTLLSRFNELPPHGPVRKSGSDLVDCFTNIPHQLVRDAWVFYREVLNERGVGFITAPRRRGTGSCVPYEPPRASPQRVTFSISDLTAAIEHSLANLWLAVGCLVGRATDGLAMGSSLAGALTRMTLIYCDIIFHATLYPGPRPPPTARGRVRYVVMLGIELLVLETRYMDDYLCLWKAPAGCTQELLDCIAELIAAWPVARYPLPCEQDGGDTFTGMRIALGTDGCASARPASLHAGSYHDEFNYPPYMDYRSFTPPSIKRAVVLGIIARVDRFTLPLDGRADALRELFQLLASSGHFPVSVIKRWAVHRRTSTPWANEWVREACAAWA